MDVDFDEYLERLKTAARIEEIIGRDEPLRGSGRSLRGVRDDNLVVQTAKGLYYWNVVGEHGDVITWVMNRKKCDFKTAVEELARLVGLEPPHWRPEELAQRQAAQKRADVLAIAVDFWQRKLAKHPAALRYCYAGRGWRRDVVEQARLGFTDGDTAGLRGQFTLHGIDLADPLVKALLGLPAGMLLYPAIENGRVVDVAGRSAATLREEEGAFVVWTALTDSEQRFEFDPQVEPDDKEHPRSRQSAHKAAKAAAKRHYNLPQELSGERRPYWNQCALPGRGLVIVVEGQADAVTLDQFELPAVALCGCALTSTEPGRRLLLLLGKHETVYLALDQDEAGKQQTRLIAAALGPLVRLVRWPGKDANDWLLALRQDEPAFEGEAGSKAEREHHAKLREYQAEDAAEVLQDAPLFVEEEARLVGDLPQRERAEGLKRFMALVARLDEFNRDVLRERLARAAGLKLREFDQLLKLVQGAADKGSSDEPAVTIAIVGGLLEGHLIETLYQPPVENAAGAAAIGGAKTFFAVRFPDGRIEQRSHVDLDGIRYVPPAPESSVLRERVVQFAPRIGELKTTRELVRAIQALIHKYVDVDIFYETLAAYYVLFSWFYDCFNTVPYLRALGDAGTGKSRLIYTVGTLCYRPIFVSGAATTSPIFRLLDRYRGTLVLDEGDFKDSDEAADIIKILNTGYQRTQGIVLRSGDKNSGFEPEVYVVYGPKVIATRKKFGDWALESRCLTKEMGGPTSRSDIPIELPRSFFTEEVPEMQAALLRYRLAHWQPFVELDLTNMDTSVEPRLNQVTLALRTIVDDPDLQADLGVFIREYNFQLIMERGMTLTAKVLEALVCQHEMEQEKPEEQRDLSMAAIAERVNELLDYENADNPDEEIGESERKVTPKKVGDILKRQLQIQTERHPTTRRYVARWDETRITGLRKRYGLDDDAVATLIAALYKLAAKRQEAQQAKVNAAQRAFGG